MAMSTRRSLSSRTTFAYKYVFSILWSTGFGFGTLNLWLNGIKKGAGPAPEFMRWQFLIGWLMGTAFLMWFSRRIKRVEVDDGFLYISNYFSEVVVPLTEIDRISESYWWMKPKTVTIHFRSETMAGPRAVFLPKYSAYWGSHPVVAELAAVRDRAIGTA